VVGDQLVISEKSGAAELVTLQNGAWPAAVASVSLPAGQRHAVRLVTRRRATSPSST
jgi:hypothetical protein